MTRTDIVVLLMLAGLIMVSPWIVANGVPDFGALLDSVNAYVDGAK